MTLASNLTKADLIRNYSISLSKVNSDMKNGIHPYVKVGKSAVRFSQADIQEYITKH